jgi:hypothetical protein
MKKVLISLIALVAAFAVFSADYTPLTSEEGALTVQSTATSNLPT